MRPESTTVPGGGAGRRDLRAVAATTLTGPVEAARAAASPGNDAQQAALPAPQQPRPHRQQSRGRSHASRRTTTHGARKGKVWPSPLGLNFPARRAGRRRPQHGGLEAQLRPPARCTYSGCSRSDGGSVAAILNFPTSPRCWRRLGEPWTPVEAEEEGKSSRACAKHVEKSGTRSPR